MERLVVMENGWLIFLCPGLVRVTAFRRRHRLHAGPFRAVVPDVPESFMTINRIVETRKNGQEVFVKWTNLDYAQCSWEDVSRPCVVGRPKGFGFYVMLRLPDCEWHFLGQGASRHTWVQFCHGFIRCAGQSAPQACKWKGLSGLSAMIGPPKKNTALYKSNAKREQGRRNVGG